jgi:hypothetical protein
MCPGKCFERYHTLKNFKVFSVGHSLSGFCWLCTQRSESYKNKVICVYFVAENSKQFEPVKHYYLTPRWEYVFLNCAGKYTFCFFTLCPCCANFLSNPARLVALQGLKIPQWPRCGNVSKCENRKGLNINMYVTCYYNWKYFVHPHSKPSV